MKIINKILLTAIFSSALFIACEDDRLDIDPTDTISVDEADKSEAGLLGVKTGMYSQLSRYEGLGRDIIVLGDLISDNAFQNSSNTGRFIYINNLSYTQGSNDITPIDRLYDAVVQANAVINTTLPETPNVKQMKAEAYVGRALAFFYAVNIYSASVASGLNPEYGMPIPTEKYDPKKTYPRVSVSDTYAQIEKDLLTSLSLFQHEGTSKTYFGPTAAKLLLSRVYLYQQKWQKAYNYALEVETASPSPFSFVDKNNYKNYFDVIVSSTAGSLGGETVFEIGYSNTNTVQINHVAGMLSKNGSYPDVEFRQSLYDSYNATDVRKTMFDYDSNNRGKNTQKGYYTTKYAKAVDKSVNYAMNIKILRMSEAKLNKIEALYHLGNETQALAELNAFAATRGSYTYTSTGPQLLNDILKERRLEFVGEGQRYFDLKRNMLPINKDANCVLNCSVAPTSHLFVLPIPQREMDYNPKMKQYPGY